MASNLSLSVLLAFSPPPSGGGGPGLEPKPVRFLTQHGRGVQSGKEPRGAFPPMPAMAATHMASRTHGSRRTLRKLSTNSRPRTQTCPLFDAAWTWGPVRQGTAWSVSANARNGGDAHGITNARVQKDALQAIHQLQTSNPNLSSF
jgi:hypothetical protein